MIHNVKTVPLLLIAISITSAFEDSPDVRFVKKIGQEIWDNREQLLLEAFDVLDLDGDIYDLLPDEDLEKDDPVTLGCAQCRVCDLLYFYSITAIC